LTHTVARCPKEMPCFAHPLQLALPLRCPYTAKILAPPMSISIITPWLLRVIIHGSR